MQFDQLKRRQFIALLGGAAAAWPLSSRAQQAAKASGLIVVVLNVASERDIDTASTILVQKQVDGLLVNPDSTLTANRDQIVALAAHHRMPALYPWREYVEAGGLMSYGTSLNDSFHQIGVYAGRILRGVRPADLPVTQPTTIELVINLKTAKTLGLDHFTETACISGCSD